MTAAASPARSTAGNGGSVTALNGQASGASRKMVCFERMGNVSSAQVYAPTAMKPACPSENSPVKPKIRFMLTASMALMPARLSIRR